MPHISGHPAPGLGDILPGWFVVPQNPITDANGAAVGRYYPTIGDMIGAAFVVPQNPVKDAMTHGVANVGKPGYDGMRSMVRTGGGISGMSCGVGCAECGGTCGGRLEGMGGIGDDIKTAFDGGVQGVMDFALDGGTGTVITAGVALLLWSVFSPSGQSDYREYMSKARKRARTKYPSRYRAAREAAGWF